MSKHKYEVTGLPVRGVAKGGVVEFEDGAQARRLVRAGHIKPVPAKKPDEPKKEN